MPADEHFAPPGPLGFGGAPLGNMFEEVTDERAEATLDAAWDAAHCVYLEDGRPAAGVDQPAG